ncbi:MAG: hypothetical protein ABC585_06170 [Candidatus Methanosuratincola petrocarbonis]
MKCKKPIDEKEFSFKIGFLKILNFEFRYKNRSYTVNLKPGNHYVLNLDDGKIMIIRRIEDGSVKWAILNENTQLGEL